jgi:hypothetical protein
VRSWAIDIGGCFDPEHVEHADAQSWHRGAIRTELDDAYDEVRALVAR